MPVPKPLKDLLALLLSCLLAFVMLEAAFTLYYLSVDKRWIRPSDRLLSEKNAFAEAAVNGKRNYVDTLFPHPYVGFVHHSIPPTGMDHLNSIGLFGQEYPLKKEKGVFVILFTGSSVASQFAGQRVEQNILEQELNAHYTTPEIKKFVVLNGGDGAWKQPQQLILYSLYADVLDGVITMDGGNEHYAMDGTNALRMEFPAINFTTAMKNFYGSTSASPLRLARMLHQAQLKNPLLRRSNLIYFAFGRLKAVLIKNAGATGSKNEAVVDGNIRKIFGLPSSWSKQEIREFNLKDYCKYLRLMTAMADAMHAKKLFLIQPAPAIDKPLSDVEKMRAGDLSYKEDYQRMADALLALKAEGIPVYSLLDAFRDHPETLYTDQFHLSPEGYAILKERIIGIIEKEWNLARH